jgi:predicted anti-sigma-YlaC factor YlaD
MPPPHWTTYLVMLLALVLVIRRNLRGRRLRVGALWVLPTLLIAFTLYLLAEHPPGPALIGGLLLALLAGSAAGWQRGRFTRIALDPETRSFTSQASLAGMIFLALLFAARLGLRDYLLQSTHGAAATAVVTDVLIVFSAGLVTVQRLEMWLRCRRMLAEAGTA